MGIGSPALRVALARQPAAPRRAGPPVHQRGLRGHRASAGTADELLLHVRSYPPDVAVVDIRLPPTHTDEGMRAACGSASSSPGVGVLVLSQYLEAGLATQLLGDDAEGVGYLLKDRISDVDDFVDAVRRVARGGSAIGGVRGGDSSPSRRGHPPDRVDEVVHVADAVLQQVADALGVVAQQLRREPRLQVLGEHQHADARLLLADPQAARMPSSVCVGGSLMSTTTTSGG
jgi:ActR/RegA family two-component response regulator